MYLRFESLYRDDQARCQTGFFWAGYVARHERPDLQDCWQLAELTRINAWFARHLDAPDKVVFRGGPRSRVNGVCRFRCDARRHIRQARYMAWLLTDIGFFIAERRSAVPGRIVWQDRYQVVAAQHVA